jgi:hypothetical protein
MILPESHAASYSLFGKMLGGNRQECSKPAGKPSLFPARHFLPKVNSPPI